jgi:hypothetical protein
MLSLRSSGHVIGNSVSVRKLAKKYAVPPPISIRDLLVKMNVRGGSELGFRYGVHNLTFRNFTDGVPDLGTFKKTFGTAEVVSELIPLWGSPVLTLAFYGLYHYYLKGRANGGLATGFCTSLSSLVCDSFWTGINATTITKSDYHKWLTAIHGRLISRESLIHFHDQGREGITRVETSCRQIEALFLHGCDRYRSPLLFFIPSGGIWDSGYFDKLNDSHCVMPYRFNYPPGHTGPRLAQNGVTTINDLHNVEMYVWDCNNPKDSDCKLIFQSIGGQLNFEYPKNSKLNSQNGITLGMMMNGQYLLDDHDMPISGPAGVRRFVLDFLLSPADIEISDKGGKRTGNFDGKIYAEIADSHPCFLIPAAYMLPIDTPLSRRITGTGAGTYAYNSVMEEKSLVFQDVATAKGQVDHLDLSPDQSQFRFTPAAEKNFKLTIGRKVGEQPRVLVVKGAGGAPGADLDVAMSSDLAQMKIGNRGAARKVEVTGVTIDPKTKKTITKQIAVTNIDAKSDLKLNLQNWKGMKSDVQMLRRTDEKD